jgi:hypothetical protein
VEVLQVAVKKQETKDKKKSKEKDAWAIGQSVYFIIVAMFLRCRFQVSPQCKKKKKKKKKKKRRRCLLKAIGLILNFLVLQF